MEEANEEGATIIDDEKDSTWLYEVLDSIGANDEYRKTIQRSGITFEIICTFGSENKKMANYGVGGKWEGTLTPGVKTDFDAISCDDNVIVIEDISKAVQNRYSLLIIRDPRRPAGYVKLQIVRGKVPGTIADLSFYDSKFKGLFEIDECKRILLTEIIGEHKDKKPYMPRPKNKPAATIGNYNGISIDVVTCYRSKHWPIEANEWLTRKRCNGWPTKDVINELKLLGYFLVRKGHVLSLEKDFEWRISLTLQERKLIFDLTDVQFKCYVVLKMLNRDIINVECITSYHWKTCLFYVIEENNLDVWRKANLFQCVKLCITRMLDWVRQGFCPNYFILSENMFDGRLPHDLRTVSENKLVKLLGDGFSFLKHVKSDNIRDYFESRRSPELSQNLRRDSIKAYKDVIWKTNIQTVEAAMYEFCLYLTYEKRTNLIELLWRMLIRIQQKDHITEHTTEETRRSLSILTPFIYMSLASNISAMCIHQPNILGRNFLLLGSYTYFMKGGITGYLKFISVLYALGCYKDCEWFLDQLNEETIKNSRSYCIGHSYDSIYAAISPTVVNIISISQLSKSTCVSFMPTELPIIPDAVKFEVFKYSTIPLTKSKREVPETPWCYGAVVDRNIYYCLLKFLIKLKFSGVNLSADDILNTYQIKDLRNVRHPEVAYNLMAWSYFTVGLTPLALEKLTMSWNPLRYLNSFLLVNNSEINYKNNQSNAANLHAWVILYNTWFTRNSYKFKFCFQCFFFSRTNLNKCSKCKTATYCSEKCQEINWKIHEVVCKVVRKYRNV
ncbi:uncharacterized protein LOC127709398 isoform X2 [Mytilus californianus]|nr:uncharacterized protein LOC127709398 isoform X2 [Mytilus californianus]XP_052070873.1 uncharacterized protein LOC127709398 isoform X2 [Mytilus californianus]XP_052070874.1 uncharacterized protein LOC127709398 isoform X2 [Mytilus californianus]XP_052070876.1 uncharacterized protein LOC127709398 isoform X2 [Mytilus californianus]